MTVRSIAASDKRLNFSSRASFADFKIISCALRRAVNHIRKTSKNVNLSKIKAFFAKLA